MFNFLKKHRPGGGGDPPIAPPYNHHWMVPTRRMTAVPAWSTVYPRGEGDNDLLTADMRFVRKNVGSVAISGCPRDAADMTDGA